jgi:hypothetical protein
MHLTQKEIQKAYAVLKQNVLTAYRQGDKRLSLSEMDKAVSFVQQFNWIYTDPEFEQILNDISNELLCLPENYVLQDDKVVLFDDWCTSYVLVLQYVEALSLHFKEVLYVTAKNIEGTTHILDRITSYKNVKVAVIPPNSDRIKRTQLILDVITGFHPSKLFLHIGYNSPVTLALYSMPKKLTRYLINLADQTFWLGAKGIDYTLEFRPFGATVSLEKRGLKKEQLLYLPFYPVVDGNPFQGFPEQTKGKVVIFSGGDFYKTLDPEYHYWNLVREILKQNQEAIFLFATKNNMGKTNDFIKSFIADNHFEDRFIYIGFRPDINEVISRCDIFMGTSPICGSLTSQLAALNKKPILQYYWPDTYDDETEQAICHNMELQISFTDTNAFLLEASALIQDEDYRKQKGELNHRAMFSKEQFNRQFRIVISSNDAPPPLKIINYTVVAERWWWCEKLGFYNTLQLLFGLMGKRR